MTSVTQIELFEPRPSESIDLCAQHLKRADAHDRLAQAFDARAMQALARWERARANVVALACVLVALGQLVVEQAGYE